MALRSGGDLRFVWKTLSRLRRWALALMLTFLATYTVRHIWQSELTTSAAEYNMFFSDVTGSMRIISGQGSNAFASAADSDSNEGRDASVAHLTTSAASTSRRTLTELELQMGLPKVALMFLCRGHMRFEAVWSVFLSGASDMAAMLQLPRQPGAAGSWEWLFSLYVHARPGYTYPPHSLFAGRQTKHSVAVAWGQHSVVDAERLLLADALGERLNTRFLLLSESCLPLYPASATYLQAMAHSKSSINACADDDLDGERRMTHRWQPDMARPFLSNDHWRRSGQWFMLTRPHAQLVADDNKVALLFEKECWSGNSDRGYRDCVGDEHYVPTLLASHGLDSETDCAGSMAGMSWATNSMHLKTWHAVDMQGDPGPFWAARRDAQQCRPESALRSATDVILQIGALRSAALASAAAASATSTASAVSTALTAVTRRLTAATASQLSAAAAIRSHFCGGSGMSANLELRRAVWGAAGPGSGLDASSAAAGVEPVRTPRRLLQAAIGGQRDAYLLNLTGMESGAGRVPDVTSGGGSEVDSGGGGDGSNAADQRGGAQAIGEEEGPVEGRVATVGGGRGDDPYLEDMRAEQADEREREAMMQAGPTATAASDGAARDRTARMTKAGSGDDDDGTGLADPYADVLADADAAATGGGGDGLGGDEDGQGDKDGHQGALVAVGGGGRGFDLDQVLGKRGEEEEEQQQRKEPRGQQAKQQAGGDDGSTGAESVAEDDEDDEALMEQQQDDHLLQQQRQEGRQQGQEEEEDEPAPLPPPPPAIDPQAVKAGAESAARLAEAASRDDPFDGAHVEEAVGDREEAEVAGTAADPWAAPAIDYDPLNAVSRRADQQQQQQLPSGEQQQEEGEAGGEHSTGQHQQPDVTTQGDILLRAMLDAYGAMPERCPLLACEFAADAAKLALAQLQGDLEWGSGQQQQRQQQQQKELSSKQQ